jgi:ABC-2 type transport system ATP-binding protein
MIEAKGLTKHYGATVAVDDLSFTVPPGQVTGFLGPNGAGKSTTMRLILGLDAPDSGSVAIGGRQMAQDPANRVNQRAIADIGHRRRDFGRLV